MQLTQFSYWEEKEPGDTWEIDGLVFGQFNLVVGRNATGKTRLLKAIARAAANNSGEEKGFAGSARIHCVFPDVRDNPEFPEAKNAASEEIALLRKEANARWGRRLQHFPFAGKMNLKVPEGNGTFSRLELAEAYRRGEGLVGPVFRERIVQRMEEIGYPIQEVVVRSWKEQLVLGVKEAKRAVITPVPRLSQGEQRTLTLLVFLTLLEAEGKNATVLIDDFGEGLDFEHASRVTEYLLRRMPQGPLQFIVATNDRYVMNAVPLEYWTVLVEDGVRTRVFNYGNSKAKFDNFKFTGLSNFDFFSMDYASAGA